MAYTTGTTAFNMDFTEIAEEAWERAGREMRTGYDLKTARRSMNLMTIEWANRGLNMWTIEQGVIDITSGLNTYSLPLDTIDLLDHVIRTGAGQQYNQSDLTCTRISVSDYATIPNKLSPGRPLQVWVQRLSGNTNLYSGTLSTAITTTSTSITLSTTDGLAGSGYIQLGAGGEFVYYNYIDGNTLSNCFRGQNNSTATAYSAGTAIYVPQLPAITLWPTPDNAQTYQFVYYRMRRVQDAGKGTTIADMNFRFLPCLVAGLAYHIAMKVPEMQIRLEMLKAAYDEQFNLAAGEDREKAALRFVPRQQYIGGSVT
jgi:hypothetical protein